MATHAVPTRKRRERSIRLTFTVRPETAEALDRIATLDGRDVSEMTMLRAGLVEEVVAAYEAFLLNGCEPLMGFPRFKDALATVASPRPAKATAPRPIYLSLVRTAGRPGSHPEKSA